MKKVRIYWVVAAAAAMLAGCAATTYQLTLMPRTSGKLYYGAATETVNGGADVSVSIDDKIYTGTWVATVPERTSGFVAGYGFGGRRSGVGIGVGTAPVIVDNPAGTEAKALLQAPDGSGLRCDFRGMSRTQTGGGTCQDDKGLLYDVQIRYKES